MPSRAFLTALTGLALGAGFVAGLVVYLAGRV